MSAKHTALSTEIYLTDSIIHHLKNWGLLGVVGLFQAHYVFTVTLKLPFFFSVLLEVESTSVSCKK